jgi:tetratricopeptide (TPR) repeat protein
MAQKPISSWLPSGIIWRTSATTSGNGFVNHQKRQAMGLAVLFSNDETPTERQTKIKGTRALGWTAANPPGLRSEITILLSLNPIPVSNIRRTYTMNAFRLFFTFLVLSLTCFAQDPPAQQAREELNLGVKAYRETNYEEAIQHFQRSEQLDSGLCNTKLYLATAYAQVYVPGVDSAENVANAKKAIDQYDATLQCEPHSVNSLKGIAFLDMQLKKFEEAKQKYREALKLDDKDPELYYATAVMDWSEAYSNSAKAKTGIDALAAKADKKTDDDDDEESDDDQAVWGEEFIRDHGCPDLRKQNIAFVEDGIQMLTRAIDLRQDYDDAMAYLNLLYHERAKIECGDRAAVATDLKKAGEWSDLAMAARKRKTEAARKCQSENVDQPGCVTSQAK